MTILMYILSIVCKGFFFSTFSPILQLQTRAILADGRRLDILNFVYISLVISNLNTYISVDHFIILKFL